MTGRLTPDQLAAVDELLNAAGHGFDGLVDRFAELTGTHELSAAHDAIYAVLLEVPQDSLRWMFAVAIGRAALRRKEAEQVTLGARRSLRVGPDPAGIWGRNALEADPVQNAHEALWDSTVAARRDADTVLGQLAAKTDEAVSEG